MIGRSFQFGVKSGPVDDPAGKPKKLDQPPEAHVIGRRTNVLQ